MQWQPSAGESRGSFPGVVYTVSWPKSHRGPCAFLPVSKMNGTRVHPGGVVRAVRAPDEPSRTLCHTFWGSRACCKGFPKDVSSVALTHCANVVLGCHRMYQA